MNDEDQNVRAGDDDLSARPWTDDQLGRSARMSAQQHRGILHDITNALTNADWSLQLIGRTATDRPTREQMCRVARRELAFARHLLTSLQTTPVQQRRAVNLSNIAAARLGLIDDRARECGITVEATYPAQPVMVAGPKTHYRRVLDNVLINALHATPRGGHVSLGVARRRDHVELSVVDTGRGMDAQTLGRVREALKTASKPGPGQGLRTTANLVTQLGGGIVVDSAPGRGTIVTVRFPAAR